MRSGPPAPFILFDDARPEGAGEARLYTDPVEVVTAHAPEAVGDALDRIARAGKLGLHAAGTIAYVAGYALAPRLTILARAFPTGVPLLFFGLFKAVHRLSSSYFTSVMHTSVL